MATMAQSLPLPISTGVDLTHNVSSMAHHALNMYVKQEVVDPDYTNRSSPPENLIEKVKRSYTRSPKPSNGPKAPRAKKIKKEPTANGEDTPTGKQTQIEDHMPVQKRKRDRFKGMTEEEVLKRVLPDHIKEGLDILIVGINPGLTAAFIQHHYAGPGNHFWKCLYLSGIIPEPMNAMQDAELLNYGIGFTNIVERTTRGSADLTRKEIAEGGEILKEKMLKYLPKIALFNGKGIYEVFCGHKNFNFGLQPDPFPGCPDTVVFVNPSSSARCTQLPRAVDKVPFYEALKRVRDYIREHGSIEGIDRSTVTFPDFKLVTAPSKNKVKDEPMEEGDSNQTQGEMSPTQNGNTKQNKAPTPKPRKPRAPRKKPTTADVKQEPSQQQPVDMSTSLPSQHQAMYQQQMAPTPAAAVQPIPAQQHIPAAHYVQQQPPVNNQVQTMSSDFLVKQEITDPMQVDKDLAATIRHNFNQQHEMLQMQQQAAAVNASLLQRQNQMAQNLLMPAAIKQERSDWSGYGMMPSGIPTTAAAALSAYQNYPYYWNYLTTSNAYMTHPYPSIPSSQQLMTQHQQQPTVAPGPIVSNVSQPGMMPNSTMASYTSPQETNSPAMSSQSTLTQASLDSLPKADSASAVTNWLQNLASSMAQ